MLIKNDPAIKSDVTVISNLYVVSQHHVNLNGEDLSNKLNQFV